MTDTRSPRAQYRDDQLGARMDVEEAQLVIIHDGWWGMSDESPLVTVHELRRADDRTLTGDARQYRRSAFVRAQPVKLRASDATKFLRFLARASCGPEPYQHLMDHTDDFPTVDITVHVRPEANMGGIILFHTQSQGRYHAPWSITHHGELFTSAGDDVGRALTPAPRGTTCTA